MRSKNKPLKILLTLKKKFGVKTCPRLRCKSHIDLKGHLLGQIPILESSRSSVLPATISYF